MAKKKSKITNIQTWGYKCDGGENPSHHHPTFMYVELKDGTFTLWRNSAGVSGFKFRSDAEEELKRRYERVELVSFKSTVIEEYDKPTVLQNLQPFQYDERIN